MFICYSKMFINTVILKKQQVFKIRPHTEYKICTKTEWYKRLQFSVSMFDSPA